MQARWISVVAARCGGETEAIPEAYPLPIHPAQYGPFAEAGMAASHASQLEALGLRGMRPQQLLESQLTAGGASNGMYARLLAQRFASVYAAKGRWSLLDWVLWVPVDAESSRSMAANLGPAPPSQPRHAQHQQQREMAPVAVAHLVKKAAEELLGQELDGVCCCCRCRHHSSLSSCINSARATPRVPQAQASSRLVALTA